MAERERLICLSDQLDEGGRGVRFTVGPDAETLPAFAIRFGGRVYAYINRCAHIPTQLDWMEGEFFEASKLYLICSTHGAVYEPESGRCAGGPCRGRGLQPLAVSERDGHIYLHE